MGGDWGCAELHLGNNGKIRLTENVEHCSKVFVNSMSAKQFDEDGSQIRWSLPAIAMKITLAFDEDCPSTGKTRMLIYLASQRTIGPCISTGQIVVTDQEYRKTYNPNIDMV